MEPRTARRATHRPSPYRRRGFTLIEVVVAVAISALVVGGVLSVGLFVRKTYKSVFSQQIALGRAKKAIEAINREILRAESPLLGLAGWGNRVEFRRYNETAVRRLELVSQDGSIFTPWDNSLIYDPNIAVANNEVVVATCLAPSDSRGAFNYAGGNQPLLVRMRVGDPVGDQAVSRTGIGVQGVEINIAAGPRNKK